MQEMKRRDFIRKGGRLTMAAGAVTMSFGVTNTREPLDNEFVHHVFFWLKEPDNPEHLARFARALKDLVTIDAIKFYHLGKPADTRREVIDSSYQFSLLTLFVDKAAHDLYQVHPVHDNFRKVADELCSKVTVFDSVNME
jgi:hypothetical protein